MEDTFRDDRMTAGAHVHAEQGSFSGPRLALLAAITFCLLLIPVELGWVPFFQRAWGFTLWQYLHPALSLALALALVLLCLPPPRALLLRGLSWLQEAMHRRSARLLVWTTFLALPPLLWLARERFYMGDSKILLFALAARDTKFYFPDVGATFLLKLAFDLGRSLGWGGVSGMQALICLAAWPALLCWMKVGTYLTPSRGWAAFATALILLGGVTRIYAGHIEVYSIVLICLALYFWASLAYLSGRCGWMVCCLALGVGLWVHLCFLFLIPSLLLLPLLVEARRPLREQIRQWSLGLAVVATPIILFFVLLWMTGHGGDLQQALTKMINWSEVGSGREHYETVWIRPWWETESGTKYVLFSRLHLKYLVNSFFLLAPAAPPVVLVFAVLSFRRLFSTQPATFLSAAIVPMLVYTSIVRPVFGPYEWDLFTVTAVCLAALAAHLLANLPESTSLVHLCAFLVAATVLLVTIPWVIVGASFHTAAGPFAIDALRASPDGSFYDTFLRELAPWL